MTKVGWCSRCEKDIIDPDEDGYPEEYVMTTDWMYGRKSYHMLCWDKHQSHWGKEYGHCFSCGRKFEEKK